MEALGLVPGDYIRAADLGAIYPRDPTWKIVRILLEEVESLKTPGKKITKGAIYFDAIKQGWLMNRTNVECLAAMFGRETDNWIGKRVSLEPEMVQVGPKKELGIRIKGSPDLDREVVAEWQPPRKAKQTRRLVPTGRPAQSRAPATNQPPPLDGFKSALDAKLGLDPVAVINFLGTVGVDVTVMDRAELGTVYSSLEEGKPRRADFEVWRAGGGF